MKRRAAQQIERTWEGSRQSVEAALVRAHERGQLVHAWAVQPYQGEVAVRVLLGPGVAPARRLTPRTVAVLAVLGALITAAAVGTVVWAVWLAVAWLVAHLLHIVGTVAGLLVVWALLSGAFGSGGNGHCSGPNSGHG